jgi:hypothetical protein
MLPRPGSASNLNRHRLQTLTLNLYNSGVDLARLYTPLKLASICPEVTVASLKGKCFVTKMVRARACWLGLQFQELTIQITVIDATGARFWARMSAYIMHERSFQPQARDNVAIRQIDLFCAPQRANAESSAGVQIDSSLCSVSRGGGNPGPGSAARRQELPSRAPPRPAQGRPAGPRPP